MDIDDTFLPVGHMRQISRITALGGPRIVGEIDLGPSHWVYAEHFPGDPIFPGSLMVEGAGQLIALWAWAGGRRGKPRFVRTAAEFHHPVGPSVDRLILEGEMRSRRYLVFGKVRVLHGPIPVASVEGVLAILPTEPQGA